VERWARLVLQYTKMAAYGNYYLDMLPFSCELDKCLPRAEN